MQLCVCDAQRAGSRDVTDDVESELRLAREQLQQANDELDQRNQQVT